MDLLRTDRITLRLWRADEADRLLDIQRRPEVMQWLDDDFANPKLLATADEARAKVERYAKLAAPGGPIGYWAIEERATAVVAGTVLMVELEERDPAVPPTGDLEIGWHLHPDATGRGLVREAAAALLELALSSGIARVHALMYPDNDPSARVCEAIGMIEQPRSMDRWYEGESRHFTAEPSTTAPES